MVVIMNCPICGAVMKFYESEVMDQFECPKCGYWMPATEE
jgi:DNA-directed RNA polymerase subunit M/transcription elongation factor TFIIS